MTSSSENPLWCRAIDRGFVLSLTIQPGAKRTEVVGIYGDTLKLRIHAPPVDGKANAALLDWLANQLQLKNNMLELIAGATSRHKKIRIQTTASLDWITRKLLPTNSNSISFV